MKLTGVLPALVTPFDKNNEIDFNALEKHMAGLRKAGVTGWVPCGSTGEYFSMSVVERTELLKFVKNFATDDEILIAGTNAPATREVIENTAIARDIGYDTVLLATPFYTRPTDRRRAACTLQQRARRGRCQPGALQLSVKRRCRNQLQNYGCIG